MRRGLGSRCSGLGVGGDRTVRMGCWVVGFAGFIVGQGRTTLGELVGASCFRMGGTGDGPSHLHLAWRTRMLKPVGLAV